MYQDLHIAVIMDGNGRWAQKRGLPRTVGHRAGAKTVGQIVEAATRLGVGALTLYAFSSDNWSRPQQEVRNLMDLLRRYLVKEAERCRKKGVRIAVIGRRDRLPPDLVRSIEAVEAQTLGGQRMLLRLAVDYSATHAIAATAARSSGRLSSPEEFADALSATIHSPTPLKQVDLLMRTGGEQRLSDFLLWECAYAELLFTPILWPDFSEADFDDALLRFAQRDRRFGQVAEDLASCRVG